MVQMQEAESQMTQFKVKVTQESNVTGDRRWGKTMDSFRWKFKVSKWNVKLQSLQIKGEAEGSKSKCHTIYRAEFMKELQ